LYFPNNKILVSIPQVVDPIFSKTLIFIIDQNSNGAIGVIINKKILSSEILDDLYFGGPIKTKENIIVCSSSNRSIKSSMKQIDKRGTINEKSQISYNEILYKKSNRFF
tara:strand:- start:252 stop:578 length:327 start_codon:yes stop_codon:yes gene_type:complete